jgi:hypothetical protein
MIIMGIGQRGTRHYPLVLVLLVSPSTGLVVVYLSHPFRDNQEKRADVI